MAEPMTRKDARAWLRRWNFVRIREADELRRLTPEQKFEQLASLFEFRGLLSAPSSTAGDDVVRARWNRLRRHGCA
jgi:hypothetical protein